MILDPSNKNMSPRPYFLKMKPRLLSETNFFETKFFRNQDETFFRNQIFWNQNPPKIGKPKCHTLKDMTSQTMVWSAPHLIKNLNIINFWRLDDQTWATRVFPGVAGRR